MTLAFRTPNLIHVFHWRQRDALCRRNRRTRGKRKENNTDHAVSCKGYKKGCSLFPESFRTGEHYFKRGECKQRPWLEPDLESSPQQGLQGSECPVSYIFPPSFLSFSSFSPYPLHLSVCLSRKVISITLPPCWFRIQNCPLQSGGVNGKKPFNKGRETLLGMWDGNALLPLLISLGLNFHSPEVPSMSRVSPPQTSWLMGQPPWLPQSSPWECQKGRMDNKLLMNWGGTNLDPSAWP